MPRSRRISADVGFGDDGLVGTVIRRNALVLKNGSFCLPVAAGGFAAGASVRRKPSRLEALSRISDPILLSLVYEVATQMAEPAGGSSSERRECFDGLDNLDNLKRVLEPSSVLRILIV